MASGLEVFASRPYPKVNNNAEYNTSTKHLTVPRGAIGEGTKQPYLNTEKRQFSGLQWTKGKT